MADEEICGEWMPRAGANCARGTGHPPPHASPAAMQKQRERAAAARPARVVTPEAKAQRNRTHKFVRLGISEERFHELLEQQGYACKLCGLPFEDGQRICADHDHACCPPQPNATAKTCGRCIRGLVHPLCNTIIEHVETWGERVRDYLVDRTGLEPVTPTV